MFLYQANESEMVRLLDRGSLHPALTLYRSKAIISAILGP